MAEVIPYIPPEKRLPELTTKVVILGGILAAIMGAANAYLGLYAGMTVSASIPAAVIAIGVFRKFNANILEINATKSVAAAAEALAAGIIFTFPALVVMYLMSGGKYGWESLMSHMTTIIAAAIVGGLLGVLFIIPLRKVFIVDLDLPYPEGVAVTEVVKVGAGSGEGLGIVGAGISIGLLFKLLNSPMGFNVWKEDFKLILGKGNFRVFAGTNTSPALVGVGYILGPKIATIVFGGGVLGWMIFLPIMGMINGYPADGIDGIYGVWRRDTMYIGIGAVIVGGIYTLWSIRSSIKRSLVESLRATKVGSSGGIKRTERDLPFKISYLVIIIIAMAIFFYFNLYDITLSILLALIMMFFAFFFSSVAGYMAGVVGSSNNPISAVTISTILFTAILLLILGIEPTVGMMATIIVGAVVCNSAAIAGDVMQELKTGQLLGSTPSKLELATLLGVTISAVVVPFVVGALYEAYGFSIPTASHPNPLPAPQALIMSTITGAVFQGSINWPMFILGMIVAVILIWKKIPVMAVAIGIYLPLPLTFPIMIGGAIKYLSDRYIRDKGNMVFSDLSTEERKGKIKEWLERSSNNGVLFSSGLVAGEALMGVTIAGFVIAGINLQLMGNIPDWPGLLVFLYILLLVAYMAVKEELDNLSELKYLFIRRK